MVFAESELRELLACANKKLDESKKQGVRLSLGSNDGAELAESSSVTRRAFMDYQLFSWLTEEITSLDHREAIVGFISRFIQRLCLTRGFVILAKDESGKILGAAQVEHRKSSPWRLLRILSKLRVFLTLLYHVFFGSIGFPSVFFRMPRELYVKRSSVLSKLEDEHRKTIKKMLPNSHEHLYLFQLATDPNTQSKGVGTALLMGLAMIADHYKLASYLETDTDRLRSFYERNEYQTASDFVLESGESTFSPNFGMIRLFGEAKNTI